MELRSYLKWPWSSRLAIQDIKPKGFFFFSFILINDSYYSRDRTEPVFIHLHTCQNFISRSITTCQRGGFSFYQLGIPAWAVVANNFQTSVDYFTLTLQVHCGFAKSSAPCLLVWTAIRTAFLSEQPSSRMLLLLWWGERVSEEPMVKRSVWTAAPLIPLTANLSHQPHGPTRPSGGQEVQPYIGSQKYLLNITNAHDSGYVTNTRRMSPVLKVI